MATSPIPPPPTVPAMAEYPTKLMINKTTPFNMRGKDSFKYTRIRICKSLAPKERAASMTPGSVSRRLVSKTRAI